MNNHKAGFVNIIGNPNVGKSTLMNLLVGERLSIITPKAQTTRHRILGIVNDENYQIVFSDTPGVIDPKYKLQESMMKFVDSSLQDADIILLLCDAEADEIIHAGYLEKLSAVDVPLLIAINKVDLIDQVKLESWVAKCKAAFPKSEILPISALHKFNQEFLLKRIIQLLPESPAYYDKDELTDHSMRFFVSEIIREKILLNYQREIPYSVEVEVTSYKEDDKLVSIDALIFVSRDSQKGIIIGHQGSSLKKVATQARIDMEKFIDKKVFLQIFVKVKKDWRNDDRSLKQFGYES